MKTTINAPSDHSLDSASSGAGLGRDATSESTRSHIGIERENSGEKGVKKGFGNVCRDKNKKKREKNTQK